MLSRWTARCRSHYLLPQPEDLLIARTPPWNRVTPTVINTIIEAITDNGLLEAFILSSMEQGLIPQYEALGHKSETQQMIRAKISHILCQTGKQAMVSLQKALKAKQKEHAEKSYFLAMTT